MKVLVIGATGDAGSRVLQQLARAGVDVRALVRRPEAADEVRKDGTEDVVIADLDEPTSLPAALDQVTQVFLATTATSDQVALETNALEAAEAAGVERIVKISNIDIPGLTTGLHGNHRAIEQRLKASPIAATILQPSFFDTVLLKQRALIDRGKVVLPFGPGRLAWVHPDDIAEVAATVLTEPGYENETLRVTGPDSLDGDDVAALLTTATGHEVHRLDPPVDAWRDAVVADGLDPWLADSTVELYRAVANNALADVSPDVERVLGRAPIGLDVFLTTAFGHFEAPERR